MNMQRFLRSGILILVASATPLKIYAQPTTSDYIKSLGGAAFYLSMEYGWKANITPTEPRFTDPNGIDRYFRDQLHWSAANLHKASDYSDFMLKPVMIGSMIWTPLFAKSGYMPMLLTNLQVFALNGVLTNTIKVIFSRQRPSAYFETWEPPEENTTESDILSFYSGHSSFAFAIATSTAYMLSESHPKHKTLIWGTALTLATTTGYLRIAADRHYTSDVLVGAIMGSLVGYWVPRYNNSPFMPTISSSQTHGNSLLNMTWGF